MIKYQEINDRIWIVYLEGKITGQIHYIPLGFQYFPCGSTVYGEVYSTLKKCKESLEDD